MDRWQYLALMAACLVGTAPLELFGPGVYRQGRRLLLTLGVVAAFFTVWDVIAIEREHWTFSPRYTSGWTVGSLPLEEIVFFVVIPICALLTFTAVGHLLRPERRRRHG